MKNTIRIVLILGLSLVLFSYAAAQTCAPAPVGLVSWWAGENNALDSRSRNNGTLQNGATFAAGNVGQGFFFDGSNDSVDLGNWFNLQTFTIEMWLNSGASQMAFADIIDNNHTNTRSWVVQYDNVGTQYHYGAPGDSGVLAFSLTPGTWQHLAITRDASRVTRLYLDNVLIGTVTSGIDIPYDGTQFLRLSGWGGGGRHFNGQVDEVSIYNRGLSAAEVAAIHSAGSAGKCKPTATVAPSGLIGWWSGDGNRKDISGNNNHVTLYGGTGFAVGHVGQGFNFDGVDDFAVTPWSDIYNTPTAVSVEAWINTPSPDTSDNPRSPVIAGRISNYSLFKTPSAQIGFEVKIGGGFLQIFSNSTLSANTPTHVAGTYDAATGLLAVYVNGVLGGSRTVSGNLDSSTFPFNIGSVHEESFFKGQIDEVSLYNRALTQVEITSIVNAGNAGKLKTVATATIGDMTVAFPAGTTVGTTQQIPLNPSLFPPLPIGTHTGLFYDIATTADYAGNATLCFNLTSFTAEQFSNLRVMHFESGSWVDLTDAANSTYPNLCTVGASSFSPFAIVNVTQGGCSTPGFANATNFPVGATPRSVAVGDFNGDGNLDLATANFDGNSVSVLLGNGSGGFGPSATFFVGSAPQSVVTGDFNLDGKLDLATANQDSNNVSVLLGNGNGGFAVASHYLAGASPRNIAVGDYNLDGSLDLAVANYASGNVSVLLGDGSGMFGTASNFNVGVRPRSVATADFNIDGNPDLAVANAGSNNVSVLFGNGSGSFGAAMSFAVGDEPHWVTVGDFNIDGKQDLAAANFLSDDLSVMLGDGTGGFAAATSLNVGDGPFSVVVGDFNSDGNPDLAAENTVSNYVSVLHGDGTGGFEAVVNFEVDLAPSAISVGDFDNDGDPDLATANRESNNVSVLLSTCINNTPPTITAVGVTLAANDSANAQIAVVSDSQQTSDTLLVTATLASGSGVTLSSIAVDLNGNVTAAVSADSSANQSQFILRVTDGGNLFAEATLTVDVSSEIQDVTPPVITPQVSGTLGNSGWYTSNAAVSWTITDEESSIGSQTGCDMQTVSADTAGVTLTCSATSAGGTASESVMIKRDATAPTLSPAISPNPVFLGGIVTASSGAADTVSGIASQSCGTPDTSTVGSKTLNCTATDMAGNTANAEAPYRVVYNFAGFFQPVDNLPALNEVKAGSSIPVKFSLYGNQGLNIFAPGFPTSGTIPCDNSAPAEVIEETVTAGSSSLSYDAAVDRYNYVWKTDRSWKLTCRQLIVKLNDGQIYVANFRFK